MPEPVGLLGGTFDPIHFGHLRLAEEACEQLALASVLLTPAGQPPHRAAPDTSAEHRLAMVRLGAHGNEHFAVDDAEIRGGGPSYTVLTLERLRKKLGAKLPLVLLLGADAFEGLPQWHRWHQLFELAHIAVANRPGHPPHARQFPEVVSAELADATKQRIVTDTAALRQSPAGHVIGFDMTPLAISASLIRARLAAGQSVRYLLPDSVLDYIRLNNLYL